MSVRSISLAKEARLLLGAWVVVMLAGVLSLVPVASTVAGLNIHGMLESLVPFGAMFGIPLLATLAFGSEFQYRTMPMLLAQPVDRRRIWREKMMVSFAAVAAAAVVYAFALHALHAKRAEEWMSVIAIAVVTMAAAPFYTFVARSMIGGLVLNLSGFFVITLVLDYLAYMAQATAHNGYQPYDRQLKALPAWFILAGVLVYAVYAAVMAWLGRRALLRLQAVDGMQAGEAVLPVSRLFPRFVTDWFRCRARGRFLNLLRREFHLLCIVWTLGVVCAAMWTAIALFGLMPTAESDGFLMLIGIAVIGNVVIAVLAGAISLGEEKTWGTHAWHLTLPVSANAQWAVKLLVALFTSSVCAALVPIIILRIGGSVGGPAHGLVGNSDIWKMLLYAALLTLAAFWSACVVKGTVRATVWVIPAALTVLASVLVASWIARLGPDMATGWGYQESWYSQALGWMVAAIGAIRMNAVTYMVYRVRFDLVMNAMLVTVVAGVALIQTHRMFCARREETSGTALRALVPIALATALCGFASDGVFLTAMQSYRQQQNILAETHRAIFTALGKAPRERRVERLSWDELSKSNQLSAGSRRWLRDATITLVIDTPEMDAKPNGPIAPVAPANLGAILPPGSEGNLSGYLAMVHLANGNQCEFQFHRAAPASARFYGGRISGTCD